MKLHRFQKWRPIMKIEKKGQEFGSLKTKVACMWWRLKWPHVVLCMVTVVLASAASKQPCKVTWYINRCPGHRWGCNCSKKNTLSSVDVCRMKFEVRGGWAHAIIGCTLILCDLVIPQPISIINNVNQESWFRTYQHIQVWFLFSLAPSGWYDQLHK